MESFHLLIHEYQQLFYKFLSRKGEHTNFLEVVLGNRLWNLSVFDFEWKEIA